MNDTATDEREAETTCASCEERIAEGALRRVVTEVADNSVVYRHFCGDVCLDQWRSAA